MASSFALDGMWVRFAGATHVGMKRTHNEDNLHLPNDERLLIVADGMGGHASGEIASQLAVETMVDYFKNTEEDNEITWPYKIDQGHHRELNRLVIGIKLANRKIYEAAQRELRFRGMGTTVVCAFFMESRVLIAHVGDSRVYRLRENEVEQLTEDHSLLNDYVKMKKLSPLEVAAFPHKNVIVRALGMKETVQVDVYSECPRLGDVYLLCSDGLSGMLSDADIHRIVVSQNDLEEAAQKLIQAANQAGGMDNITVALARVQPG